jgi:hypothetical protein
LYHCNSLKCLKQARKCLFLLHKHFLTYQIFRLLIQGNFQILPMLLLCISHHPALIPLQSLHLLWFFSKNL